MQRSGKRLALCAVLALIFLTVSAQADVPELQFLPATEKLEALAQRLDSNVDRDRLASVADLVGLDHAGPPIPVHLAPEGTIAAKRAPSWGVGYATSTGHVFLLPGRVPGYPNRDIENVLVHEVAHVLMDRAARGGHVPRWFHEGLALYAARDWTLEDRTRLIWVTVRGHGSALDDLEGQFQRGATSANRAYAFSGAFVRYLIEEHGHGAPAEILDGVAEGKSFADAVLGATGRTLPEVETSYFRHLDFWNKWVPFLTSSTTLWIAISLLAIYAFKRRRDRDAEILARWDEEERQHELAQTSTDGWVN